MKCYKSRTNPTIGGIFITPDNARRVIPDQWIHDMKIMNDATLIRFCYASCIVEISGYHLDKIFDDATIGKLGTITVAMPADDVKAAQATSDPFVTSIVHFPLTPVAAHELERVDLETSYDESELELENFDDC